MNFKKRKNHGLKCWLLELIGEAKSEKALSILIKNLRSDDESYRSWAIYGLEKLDTKEARRVLWEDRSNTL